MGGDKKGIDYYTTPQKKCKRIKGLLPFYLWLRQRTFFRRYKACFAKFSDLNERNITQ